MSGVAFSCLLLLPASAHAAGAGVVGENLLWLALLIGLAPIIGAFAAGLLFEPVFLRHFEMPRIVQAAAPLLPEGEAGRELRTLADPTLVAIALGITFAAVAGKLAAGFAAGRGVNAWIVGWGMVPRGEVGLIFAVAGRQLGVLDEAMFSIIVIMVILTTLLTPPVLTAQLRRKPD